MKNLYFLLILITSISISAQSKCDDANYYLVSAYSHVKSSFEANNISHLKYYANRSIESLKLSKKQLTQCDCVPALTLADKAIFLLEKVEAEKTYEDARFYVKQGRDISKESVIAIEKCSTAPTKVSTTNNQALDDLEQEQLKLKQQQEALKLKEAEIKTRLAAQKEKDSQHQKETLILNYKTAISANIKTYNETLKTCDCDHTPLKTMDDLEDSASKNIKDVKIYYINSLKALTLNYLSALDLCAK
ncbi:hypothetical protein [Mariniflexile sp. AS56]|uniref:hypothetical protein n=1 Tax=Mariniflexile sp. AS56 TaxID=3063957 RepID=UPI0026EA718F|nr:hypothetical protein [Mariniflexile sp. AS56]MDO7171485.1 hypothetical protein [Mariniflexile sp. AS56]